MDEAMKKRTIERSLALYARAKEIIPGAAQLISRRPTRAALGVSPIYAERAKGCRIWDVDGNEYIDWSSGVGPIILGYCDEVVDAAVSEQIKRGSVFSILEENQVLLAEELVRLIPSAEMVRFCKGGGEACTMAVRIARGITGKDKVLFCGYHGWHDWYLAANLSGENLAGHLFNGIDPTGVPRALEGTSQPFAYGDIDSLEQLLVEYRGEVACIIMEPMRSEEPPQGYLAQVRALADEHGVLLVFDEVSSGFRVALGGAQQYLGVTPDLSVFAKALSNGYPLGAVVGKRTYMAPSEQMFISSAYWDDAIGTAAALATLRELQRRDAVAHFMDIGALFKKEINEAAERVGLAAECYGTAAHPGIRFAIDDEMTLKKVQTLFIQENARGGAILATGIFLNCAHDEEAVRQTARIVEQSFTVIRRALESDALDAVLEGPVQEELFQRLVR
jgi:glutamate-1-semialdehyde aminotransferase